MKPPLKLVNKIKFKVVFPKKKNRILTSVNSPLGINSVSLTRDILPKLKPIAVLNGAVENTPCTQQTLFLNIKFASGLKTYNLKQPL